MAQHRNTEFVGVSLTPDARDALRRLTVAVSAKLGRQLSMSEALIYTEQQARATTLRPTAMKGHDQ